MILAGCGGVGFSMAAGIRQQERLLRQMTRVLGVLESELQYRLTPLPELCGVASRECAGILGHIFRELGDVLSRLEKEDAAACMDLVLGHHRDLPGKLRKHLRHLGRSLGRFDLPGQLQGLQSVCDGCRRDLDQLRKNADVRQKSYQTLALCAGASLVILFV